jgi:serine/threonine-protein kinase
MGVSGVQVISRVGKRLRRLFGLAPHADESPNGKVSASLLASELGDADTGAPQPRLLEPRRFYRGWEVKKCLGAGGNAEVFEVYDPEMDASYALKCIPVRHLNTPRTLERARAEARVLGRLQHPNLVRAVDAGIDAEKRMFWIRMELLEGTTLRTIISGITGISGIGDPLLLDALRYVLDVAAGMSCLHENGVVHRDLKPENIILTEKFQIKILDLGTAKFYGLGLNTSGETILGTFAYMSPEQVNGDEVDPRSDIYALGLILYELLAGFHPLVRDGILPSLKEMCRRQLMDAPRPLTEVVPGFPPCLWHVIAKALHKDPAWRYQSMLEFSGALVAARREILSELSDEATASGPQDEPGSRREYLAPQPAPRTPPEPPGSAPRVVTGRSVPISLEGVEVPGESTSSGAKEAREPRHVTTAPSRRRTGTQPADMTATPPLPRAEVDETLRSEIEEMAEAQPAPAPLRAAVWIAFCTAALAVSVGLGLSWAKGRREAPIAEDPPPAGSSTAAPPLRSSELPGGTPTPSDPPPASAVLPASPPVAPASPAPAQASSARSTQPPGKPRTPPTRKPPPKEDMPLF